MAFLFSIFQRFKIVVSFTVLFLVSNVLFAQKRVANNIGYSTPYVTKKMEWVYGGCRFFLNMSLRTNIYNYYKSLPKKEHKIKYT